MHKHSLDPTFKMGRERQGEVNFDYLPREAEEIWKIKKEGVSMVQGQVFLKGGGGDTFPISFLRFIIFTTFALDETHSTHLMLWHF